jgi:hypothetical protein
VQILKPEEQHEGVMDQLVRLDAVQVLLSLLALLVQKYKY